MGNQASILDARQRIVDYLRGELIGPRGGEQEELDEAAYGRYTAGTLYPQSEDSASVTAGEEEETQGAAGEDGKSRSTENFGDDPIVLAGQYLPASMGISFFITGDPALTVDVNGGRYEESEHGRKYRRIPLSNRNDNGTLNILRPEKENPCRVELFEKKARLEVLWRKGKNGWLVTASLINQIKGKDGHPDGGDCLHQMKITCRPAEGGRISTYPRTRLLTDDPEEHILDLLYRHQAAYGTGHGCSVDWSKPVDGCVEEIHSEFLPSYQVAPITYDLDGDYKQILNQHYLANGEKYPKELIKGLDTFVAGYKQWVKGLHEKPDDIPEDLKKEKEVLLDRLDNAVRRMERGVNLLRNDETVLHAFCLANRAMLMQYIHAGDDYSGKIHPLEGRKYQEADMDAFRDRIWRPFQLGYQLLTISSVAFPEDPDREVVDLIWFPTGGGKTEAYLAVAAFLIFHRRMLHGRQGEGTVVLMRYTLRLLTTQQFQRAATLLCACEMIRREDETRLGSEQIAIGLWVGEATTPNTYQQANDKFQEYLDQAEPNNPFQIDKCPWCGTEMMPSGRSEDLNRYGVNVSPTYFALFCPLDDCPFHLELPVRVVDDQIYDRPPTLLLATVDKFARMAWEEKSMALFGGHTRRPPELIIQDELHLITGPLGTIVGLYEIAIDALASWDGRPPKILASTATIRRADEQCSGLYGRSLELFPPSGLEASDSYFAREDRKQPGRLYVGMMGQGHTGSTSMIRTAAAILQAPVELGLKGDALDAFSTMIAYHNSLREVGKTLTFAADDIPAWIKVIAKDQAHQRNLDSHLVEELTSNKMAGHLLKILERLKKTNDKGDAISLLVCSNMFSVGVDVQRLGLMLVNGQPKSTSEYIQCTSRIGRRDPGLVVTLLSPTKPRDRSHYERFVGFHQALYRFVEPGSVTPFSPPARGRALHAMLVIAVRHGAGLNVDGCAGEFRQNMKGMDWLVEFLRKRVEKIDPEEAKDTVEEFKRLMAEWEVMALKGGTLFYDNQSAQKRTLLKNAGNKRQEGWETQQSMRNVDKSAILQVITRQP